MNCVLGCNIAVKTLFCRGKTILLFNEKLINLNVLVRRDISKLALFLGGALAHLIEIYLFP